MPQKVFVSKADRHTVVIDGEMHAFVKSYAHKYNISITEAVYLLLSRGLVKDAGGDPDKVQLPGKKIQNLYQPSALTQKGLDKPLKSATPIKTSECQQL